MTPDCEKPGDCAYPGCDCPEDDDPFDEDDRKRNMGTRRNFGSWLAELEEDVIQGDYGYEPGEFTVYPEDWRDMYRRGLTPQQAFRRALDMHACGRVEDECLRSINAARIAFADAGMFAQIGASPSARLG